MTLGATARKFIKPRPTFKDVLSPEQSKVMSIFLKDLSWAGAKAVDAGVKPNVGEFIECWIGKTKTQEEWKDERIWQARERKKNAVKQKCS